LRPAGRVLLNRGPAGRRILWIGAPIGRGGETLTAETRHYRRASLSWQPPALKAFAVPGRPGRMVVTEGLLAVDARERRMGTFHGRIASDG
jgi:hypothetical protein